MKAGSSDVTVRLCPDGPLLVRGAGAVLDEGGNEHPVTRPVVAVCACGKSARRPWCDGTHKALPGYQAARLAPVRGELPGDEDPASR